MKTLRYSVSDIPKRISTNKEGRISTQFMSGSLQTENLSSKKAIEESVKMEGYELSFRKAGKIRKETQQPMSGHSDFWLG